MKPNSNKWGVAFSVFIFVVSSIKNFRCNAYDTKKVVLFEILLFAGGVAACLFSNLFKVKSEEENVKKARKTAGYLCMMEILGFSMYYLPVCFLQQRFYLFVVLFATVISAVSYYPVYLLLKKSFSKEGH